MARSKSIFAAAASALIGLVVVVACGGDDSDTSAEVDAGRPAPPPQEIIEDAGPPDTGRPVPTGPAKRIFAKRFVVNVRTAPDREAFRVGYLRAGAVFKATTSGPLGEERCRGGWYELADTGGFVCNGRDVIAFDGRRLPERRPAQPDFDEPLPYRYARTRRDVPMYRRLPTDEEAAEFEGYRIPGLVVEGEAEGDDAGGDDDDGETVAAATPTVTASGAAGAGATAPAEGAGTGASTKRAVASETTPPQDARPAVAREASGDDSAPEGDGDEESEEESVITLADLAGSRDTVLTRRLVKGFIVSLDRDFRIRARRYWRSLSNGYIPYSSQVEVHGSDFHGQVLARGEPEPEPEPEPEAASPSARRPRPAAPAPRRRRAAPFEHESPMRLPLGYVLSSKTSEYRPREGRAPRRGSSPGYHHVFQVTGHQTHGDEEFVATDDERLFRARDVVVIEARAIPEGVGPDDAWIDVDLGRQSLVAYEGSEPVYATLVSTGRIRDPDDPDRDMRTPSGLFRVTSKHVTHTMDGDHAVDGPYSIDDVPYVMYFQLAYALHSAFWHDGFGRPRSHGCVNMAPRDAHWIFDWAHPRLPERWHGVYPTEEAPGTFIYIHGDTPEG